MDPRSSTDMIDQYHEVLELLAYEVNSVIGGAAPSGDNKDAFTAINTTRLMTVLMFALSKLAARCQDLIPRVALCLTKITKQHAAKEGDSYGRKAVLERATELVRTLQHPSVAAAVLGHDASGADSNQELRHSDPTSALALLRFTKTSS
eukprot:m.239052 g.239052  ORF g.239052 m.239052 type:complete len:149 (-) comp16062_c0_seq26:1341-1787(-)